MFGFKRSMVLAVAILSWILYNYTIDNQLLWYFLTVLLSMVVILTITTYDHDYWKNRGVFSPPAWPVVGHILSVVRFKEQGGMCFKRIYETYRNVRFLGTHQFYQRTLVICDPELIKRICVVDFQHFVDRGFFFNKDVDPLAGSVLFLRGNEWRRLRAKISPIFSPIKLRGMFPLIDSTAKDFVVRIKELLEAKYKESSKENLLSAESNSFSNLNKRNSPDEKGEKEDADMSELTETNKANNNVVTNALINGVESTISKHILVNSKTIHTNQIKNNVSNINHKQKDNIKNENNEENYSKTNGVKEQNTTEITSENSELNSLKSNILKEIDRVEKEIQNISVEVDSQKLVGGYTSNTLKEIDQVEKEIQDISIEVDSEKLVGGNNTSNTLKEIDQVEKEIQNISVKVDSEKLVEGYTSNKLKEIGQVEKEIQDISIEVDSEKLVGGYTADAIVPCAFGLKSNVMYDAEDPFAVALHAFYEMSVYNIFEKTMRQFWPAFVLFFRMRIIPKKTHDFFYNIVTSVLKAREKGEQEKRGDFIDMMMALRSDDTNNNNKNDDDVEITDMVISANALIIFLGGFETTSSTLAFLLLELAAHPRVQDAMREEILRVMEKHGGKISYELLQELTYMEMVIQETLRLYPPFPSIQRMCTKDYVIPGTSVVVEKGTIVLFPTLGIQRDDRYFEDGNAFRPERWREGSKQPPPGVYMPFGDGPRYCIGKRFAMIQMKCCLVRVLRRVRVSPARTRTRTAPFAPDPRAPLTLHPLDARVTLHFL